MTEPCNYKPISLSSLIYKVIEKVVHDLTSTFLNSENLLYTYQSGFRKKHSTDFCLSYLNNKILEGFDKGMLTSLILIHLQKVFDAIDHDVQLQKLYAIGFLKHTSNWFKSYLSNRSFLVNLGNNFSQSPSVSCRVLQGSILGSLLFLVYVHDMSQAVKCHSFLYADDSCLLCQHKDIHEFEKQLNEDFSNMCDWFAINKLSIHFGEDKAKSILFTSIFKKKNI